MIPRLVTEVCMSASRTIWVQYTEDMIENMNRRTLTFYSEIAERVGGAGSL